MNKKTKPIQSVPKFWNIASTGNNSGEILLYGDVCSATPTDWWTGEPLAGLYITPEGFLEDLEAVKGKENITIKLNSCGGDLYTGIAIHNAIKGLSGHKTVIVEGIAASAASVIMCAGDDVQLYPGSMVMIHGVSALLYDYFNAQDLKKILKDFEASEKAIAEIYHAKTGLEVDHLRTMMTRETWFVGQEAVDNGFANTLLTDEGPAAALSNDKKVMLVAGIRHDVSAFKHIPGTVPVNNSIHSADAVGNKNKPSGNPVGENKKEETRNMTLEELRAQHADLVAQIEQQAVANARETTIADAAAQERARLQAIDEIANAVGDSQLVHDAKYGDKPCTAEQLAMQALRKQSALGAQHLDNVNKDNSASGAQEVGTDPNGGAAGEPENDEQKVADLVNAYQSAKK